MNKWLYRAVGAVGVASGALLLSNGVAHAQAANDAKPDLDSQAMRGLVADFFTPMGQHREELIPGLGGGGGGSGPSKLIGGLTGGLTGGGGPGGLLSGLLSGLTGGGEGGGLLSGLTGLAGGLTGQGGEGGQQAGAVRGPQGAPQGGGPQGGSVSGSFGGSFDGQQGGSFGGSFGAQDGRLGASFGGSFDGGDGAPLGGSHGARQGGQLGTQQSGQLGSRQGGQLGTQQSGQLGGPAGGGANSGRPQSSRTGNPASTAQRNPVSNKASRGTATNTVAQRPIQLNPEMARQVNNGTGPMAEALIADAVAKELGLSEENLPLVGELPGVSALTGSDGPLKGLLGVGEVANGLPLVGDVLGGKLDPANLTNLPVVGELTQGLLSTDEAGALPVVGNLPLVGQALRDVGKRIADATDNLKSPLGGRPAAHDDDGASFDSVSADAMPPNASQPAISANVSALDGLPSLLPATVSQVANAAVAAPKPATGQTAAQTSRAAQAPIHVGRHRATERPEVADPELEAAPSADTLVGTLAGVAGSAVGGNVGTLPLSTLVRGMSVVNEVPLVGELGTQLAVLKGLPLVGTLTGLVPVESDTAA